MNREVVKTEYEAIRPRYLKFTDRLYDLILDLLQSSQIQYHLVKKRTKDVESLCDKACRPGKNYVSPLSEITDLSGIRVILYYPDDVMKTSEIIREQFEVLHNHSEDKATRLNENEFGYLSVHFVVRISDNRKSLPEWKDFAEFTAEIQIRTVLQHAWAAIEHGFQYKSTINAPKQLRRRLFRLSGLLELADEEFMAIRDAHSKIVAEDTSKTIQNNTEISTITIGKFIESTDLREKYEKIANDNVDTLVEFCHLEIGEDYADVATVCELVDIRTIADFGEKLSLAEETNLPKLEGLLKSGTWTASPIYLIQLLLLISYGGKLSTHILQDSLEWDDYTAQAVIDCAQT